jgi:hypothetical protein
MAKKRQATPPQPLELEKTLLVDNQEYNVNAVHATQVDSNLIINQVGIEGTSTPTVFNGSTETEISIVPSSGGKFSGPICSESAINVRTGEKIKNEAVLNYGDFNEVILKSLINNSILYNWSSKTLTPALEESTAVRGISLIVGTETELTSTATNNLGFAKLNAQTNNKWLPAYLYICTDTKNIYYGTSSSPTATQLAITAKNLKIPQKILVNLASSTEGTLDGNSTTTIKPGITGTLAITNGGTGGTTKTAAAFNIFEDLHHTDDAVDDNTKIVFRMAEPSASSGVFYTKTAGKLLEYIAANHTHGTSGLTGILPITQGGTGASTKTGAITNIINGNDINPKTVTVTANQYMDDNAFGINMQNSDIKNANGIYFSDYANTGTEGLCFARVGDSNSITDATAVTWDRFYAYNGKLFFAPNTSVSTGHDNATKYEIWHAGNIDTVSAARRRKITISTNSPGTSDGVEGDIWIVYK